MSVIELTDDNFKSEVTGAPGIVIVDFWAEWCAPCRMLAPFFDQVSEGATGKAKFGKYNVDSGKTASEYGVMSIPTVIIFKDGKKIESLTAAQTKESLVKRIEELSKK
jgi:thioredoxin 1